MKITGLLNFLQLHIRISTPVSITDIPYHISSIDNVNKFTKRYLHFVTYDTSDNFLKVLILYFGFLGGVLPINRLPLAPCVKSFLYALFRARSFILVHIFLKVK